MRNTPAISRILVFLLPFLVLPASSTPGRAGSGREAVSPYRQGLKGPAAYDDSPGEAISLGKTLVRISSSVGEDLTGVPVDPAVVEQEIDHLAGKIGPALRDRRNPREVISALNRFLFVEEGFAYDDDSGNPDNYLLHRVIARRRGNCLGLTALYLLLAERLSLPLQGVYVPSHTFVRYEDKGVRFNIETGKQGAEWEDRRYVREFRLSEGRPYMLSLGTKEMIGVYLKSLGASYSRQGREDRALRLYREAAAFYPDLPDVYFNAGVSLHRKDFLDEAIAQYRRALALDPDLAVARDNIAVALAKTGRFGQALAEARKAVALRPGNPATLANLAATLCASGRLEEGIRVYRKVLEIDPENTRALAGLTKAYYSLGEFHEALVICDRAIERGWEPDAAMLGTLEKYRNPSVGSLP